ncbi:PREDICTED: uncharacterized protein LOC108690805 [Atta colombica]|uniref:uncharacterized protein LOC108690805 n=1 Tax=Atta colombica TaxID=520822 RepID=UPI00084CAE03|nr:PREDICTED: uncharacterized protein LOC108690805 [Atta colombica]
MRRWTTIMEKITLTMRIPTNSRHNAQEEEEKRRVFGEAYQAAIWNTVDQFLRRLHTVDEKYSTIAPKYQQHNVRGLHELQRRELYEWYFAVRHDCWWQYRKFVVYIWSDLYNHKESSDSRKSVIWHRQSNSELASAGESGQTLTK